MAVSVVDINWDIGEAFGQWRVSQGPRAFKVQSRMLLCARKWHRTRANNAASISVARPQVVHGFAART